jgi:hypothetical protein
MLTVVEAAGVLRIGRTLAYQLASRYLAGEPDGLPVIRLGGCLRVPRSALDDRMRGSEPPAAAELETVVAAAVDRLLATEEPETTASSRPNRRRIARRGSAQLSLLDGS